jgi:hypothetical protein
MFVNAQETSVCRIPETALTCEILLPAVQKFQYYYCWLSVITVCKKKKGMARKCPCLIFTRQKY